MTIRKRVVLNILLGISLAYLCLDAPVSAHRSGCHRWQTCPSDHGTYTTRSPSSTPGSRGQESSKIVPQESTTAPAQAEKPADNSTSQSGQRQGEDRQNLQELERQADEHTCERDYMREGEDRVEQCKWDIYERVLLTHCQQVAPQSVQRCMYSEFIRQG